MFVVFLFAAAVEISGPDVELCTDSVQALFAAMDERAKVIEDANNPSTRMSRTFSESRGDAAVERYTKQIQQLREQLDEQQCTVRFVHEGEPNAPSGTRDGQ
jgi:hypothetical protein